MLRRRPAVVPCRARASRRIHRCRACFLLALLRRRAGRRDFPADLGHPGADRGGRDRSSPTSGCHAEPRTGRCRAALALARPRRLVGRARLGPGGAARPVPAAAAAAAPSASPSRRRRPADRGRRTAQRRRPRRPLGLPRPQARLWAGRLGARRRRRTSRELLARLPDGDRRADPCAGCSGSCSLAPGRATPAPDAARRAGRPAARDGRGRRPRPSLLAAGARPGRRPSSLPLRLQAPSRGRRGSSRVRRRSAGRPALPPWPRPTLVCAALARDAAAVELGLDRLGWPSGAPRSTRACAGARARRGARRTRRAVEPPVAGRSAAAAAAAPVPLDVDPSRGRRAAGSRRAGRWPPTPTSPSAARAAAAADAPPAPQRAPGLTAAAPGGLGRWPWPRCRPTGRPRWAALVDGLGLRSARAGLGGPGRPAAGAGDRARSALVAAASRRARPASSGGDAPASPCSCSTAGRGARRRSPLREALRRAASALGLEPEAAALAPAPARRSGCERACSTRSSR